MGVLRLGLVALAASGCVLPFPKKSTPPPPPPPQYYYYPPPYYPYPQPPPQPQPQPKPPPQPQPPPQPEPPPQPVVHEDTESPPAKPEPPPPDPRKHDDFLRLAIGGGTAGTLAPNRDLDPSFGAELQWDRHIHGIVSVGIHTHLSLRQWQVLADAYADLYDLDALQDEDNGGEKAVRALGVMFGWIGAWLAGTGLLGAGPQVTFAPERRVRPWAAIGTTALLSIDTRDPEEEVVFAHAMFVAVGYDFGRGGISVRAHYAPEDGFPIGSTGSPLASLTASFEILWDEPALDRGAHPE